MNIHEYQAKELLANFGVAVPRGHVAATPDDSVYRARALGGDKWAVKAQIHSGARGKAGGIRLCSSEEEVRCAAEDLLGKRLVTSQTGPRGKKVHRLYIEKASTIKREFYLGLMLDRTTQRVVVAASADGGMDIEKISTDNPDSIIREIIEPAVGMQQFQARELAYGLGFKGKAATQAAKTIIGCYRAFRELDATMVEINPLVLTQDERVLALDAKMTFDDNAMFRRQHILELHDRTQEDPRETNAKEHGLSYVGLDGDIGCIINGAGLAMATMDMIKLAGGEPANFLDIGGGASPERVAKSFNVVLSDDKVKAILVNIFAGINRCDWVAKGIAEAFGMAGVSVPLVVRLAGTNVEEGRKILRDSGLPIIAAGSLAEAAELVVGTLNGDGGGKGEAA
jgi:succinyl-CoA synthetase beta subunit